MRGVGLGLGMDIPLIPDVFVGLAVPMVETPPVPTGYGYLSQVLDATNGVWTNAPGGYDYQWYRNGTAIGGATGKTYPVTLADEGKKLTRRTIATNGVGSGVIFTDFAALWMPNNISVGIDAWWDCSDPSKISEIAGRVNAIAPTLGTITASQGSGSAQPLISTYNGLPCIQWDQDGHLDFSDSKSAASPWALLFGTAAPYYASFAAGFFNIGGNNSNQRLARGFWGPTAPTPNLRDNSGGSVTMDPLVDMKAAGVSSHSHVKVAGPGNTGELNTRIDGDGGHVPLTPTAITFASNGTGRIGCYAANTARAGFTWLTTLYTSAPPTTNDLEKWEGFVAWRYKDQTNLPPSHPYKTVPPTP